MLFYQEKNKPDETFGELFDPDIIDEEVTAGFDQGRGILTTLLGLLKILNELVLVLVILGTLVMSGVNGQQTKILIYAEKF